MGSNKDGAPATENSRNIYIYIYCLRAVSAIVIVIYHYRHPAMYSPFWPADQGLPLDSIFHLIYRYGFLAVELFFLLSGFGLASQYLGAAPGRRRSFGSYLTPKLKRLYPAFFLTLLICTALQLAVHAVKGTYLLGIKNYSLVDLCFSFSLMESGLLSPAVPFNVPTWFLTPLFACYILFWVVFYGESLPEDNTYKLLCSFLLMLAGAVVLYKKWQFPLLNERMGRGLYAFWFGVLLGHACERRETADKLVRCAAFILLLVSAWLVKLGLAGNLYLCSVWSWGALVLLLHRSDRVEHALQPAKKIIFWFKDLSYPIFCVHYVFLTVIAAADQFWDIHRFFDKIWFFMLYLAVVIGSAKGIEKICNFMTERKRTV